MAAPKNAPLRNLTREQLEPLWFRHTVSLDRIAAALGVTRQGLIYKARTLGLPPRGKNRKPQTKGPDDLFREMWLAGVHTEEMAAYFGYSCRSAVSMRAGKLGLPRRTRTTKRTKGRVGGWVETTSLVQFLEPRLAQRMAERRALEAVAGHVR